MRLPETKQTNFSDWTEKRESSMLPPKPLIIFVQLPNFTADAVEASHRQASGFVRQKPQTPSDGPGLAPLMLSAQLPIVVVCRDVLHTQQDENCAKHSSRATPFVAIRIIVHLAFSGLCRWIFYSRASGQKDGLGRHRRCSTRWKRFVHLSGSYLHATVGVRRCNGVEILSLIV